LEIEIVVGNLLEAEADAIVNPANSRGLMGGGVAAAIKAAGGPAIEAEAIQQSWIPIGEAVFTTAGHLRFAGVIHAPTMEEPGTEATVENVAAATMASLRLADSIGLESIAFPGMGTGVGGLDFESAARAMISAIRRFQPQHLRRVVLVARDEALAEAWRDALKSQDEVHD
jgi:O-acetyl-ADP-ribose deacetylase (regulator of RNase III)